MTKCGRKNLYIGLAGLFLMPVCWFRSMNYLAYVSMASNVCLFLSCKFCFFNRFSICHHKVCFGKWANKNRAIRLVELFHSIGPSFFLRCCSIRFWGKWNRTEYSCINERASEVLVCFDKSFDHLRRYNRNLLSNSVLCKNSLSICVFKLTYFLVLRYSNQRYSNFEPTSRWTYSNNLNSVQYRFDR